MEYTQEELDLMLRYEVQIVLWEDKFVGTIFNNLDYGEFPVCETNMADTITLWCDEKEWRHDNIQFHTIAEKVTKLQLKKFTNTKTAEEVINYCLRNGGEDEVTMVEEVEWKGKVYFRGENGDLYDPDTSEVVGTMPQYVYDKIVKNK